MRRGWWRLQFDSGWGWGWRRVRGGEGCRAGTGGAIYEVFTECLEDEDGGSGGVEGRGGSRKEGG